VKSVSLMLLGLALIVLQAAPVCAQEKRAKKQAQNPPRQIVAVEKQLAELNLTDDQKKKVDDILASYKPKFADAQAKAPKLTKEQRQAQKEATEKAKADGKKGKELQAEVNAALNLTDEQKKEREAAASATKELQASLKKELAGVLTADQAKVLSKGKKKQ
jgi:Spy/CpxP family protein refolding chaperone